MLREEEAIPYDLSEWDPTKKQLDNLPFNVNIEWDKILKLWITI